MMMKMRNQRYRKPEECQLEQEDEQEELLTLGWKNGWFTQLHVEGTKVKFLIYTGATVIVLPEHMIRELDRLREIRPPRATLCMYDKAVLQTRGMFTLQICHPRTATRRAVDFYVAAKHEQPILGF